MLNARTKVDRLKESKSQVQLLQDELVDKIDFSLLLRVTLDTLNI